MTGGEDFGPKRHRVEPGLLRAAPCRVKGSEKRFS